MIWNEESWVVEKTIRFFYKRNVDIEIISAYTKTKK